MLKLKLLVANWQTYNRKDWIAFNNGVLEVASNQLSEYKTGFSFTSYLERDYQSLTDLQPEVSVIDRLKIHCPHFYNWAMTAMKGDTQKVVKLLAIINGVIKFRFFDW